MRKVIKCISCPIGCDITISANSGIITEISGNDCKRGEEYARNEFLNPKRFLTTVVKAENFYLPLVSVRTDRPIQKEKLLDCMEVLRRIKITAPFTIGQIVIENILDTGANIIITKS